MKLISAAKQRVGTEGEQSALGEAGDAGGRPAGASGKLLPDGLFPVLPKLRDSPVPERADLFRKKLQACTYTFNFSSDTQGREKEAKRQTLLELVEHVNSTRNCFNDTTCQDVVQMISVNIFRSLPTKDRSAAAVYEEDDEPMLERAWPHLQIVYELFLRFVTSTDVDPRAARRYVDQGLIVKVLELFDSEDPRERDYLKTILHRIYGKFMVLRAFIRRAIQHTFFKVLYECETHKGVGELLEILGSIANGFALPLKEEHKDFLVRALIPLHKVKSLASFHQQLSYCTTQYVEKDPRLSYVIITSMLRFWPLSNASKQVLLLNELEETLELTQPGEFSRMQGELSRRIALCITCPHFQVAERALFLWNNGYIVKLFNQNRQTIFPAVIDALYRNSKQHWNSAVHGLTFNVLNLMMEEDPQLFDECSAKHKEDEEEEERREAARKQNWDFLQELHDRKATGRGA